jgi:cobalamin-dependent methionine synthase I
LKQQDLQLAGIEGKTGHLILWPPRETTTGKALVTKPKPLTIINKNLYSGAQAVGKDKERAAKRIFSQHSATKSCQSIDPFAKVYRCNAEQQSVMGRNL